MTDVFQVQGDIAAKVADALGVALADSTQRELAAKPTENLAAYDEYLKGEAASQAMGVTDPPSLRRAIAYYQNAVALDSTFALAWARLSHAQIRLYGNSIPDPALAEQARLAAERARRLIPRSRWSTAPSARTTYGMRPRSSSRARSPSTSRASGSPPTTLACSAALASIESNLGRWDSAVGPTRPRRDAGPPRREHPGQQADMLLCLRQYPKADSAADRALGLAPTNASAGGAEGDGAAGPGSSRQRAGGGSGGRRRGSSPRPS